MWNEADHVADLVADLASQDFEGQLELLVADGRSTDDSVARLREAAAGEKLQVTILDNPNRWVSYALNACVEAAEGDLIVRIDCHSRYPSDYVSRCVTAAEETGADNVGGVFVPRGRTPTEHAVACAMDSPFGGIHWTRHGSSDRVEVDTVPYGAFRPSAFRRAGLFDESLVRNQDDEFNLRLRRAGGRVVLDPAIRFNYTPRGSLVRLFRQYYEYGRWKAPVMRRHHQATSARSLVPGVVVAIAILLAVLSLWHPHAAVLLALKASTYTASALVFGVVALRRRREAWRLLPRVVAVFPTIHVAHGLGMITGWLRGPRPRPASGQGALR
jgi:glycosyltransferase involved in cell wall biosynthesis